MFLARGALVSSLLLIVLLFAQLGFAVSDPQLETHTVANGAPVDESLKARTNAERLQVGLPLRRPKRLFHQSPSRVQGIYLPNQFAVPGRGADNPYTCSTARQSFERPHVSCSLMYTPVNLPASYPWLL